MPGASRATLHKVSQEQCCSRRWYSWDNITQIKTLCIVALEAPDNNTQNKKSCSKLSLDNLAQVKILCNVVQESPNRKSPVQFGPNTSGTVLHRYKPMLSLRLQTTLHRKNPMQCCLRGSSKHCTRKNPDNIVWTISGHSVYIYIRSFT